VTRTGRMSEKPEEEFEDEEPDEVEEAAEDPTSTA
jgi:hypothetical protein